MQYESLMPIASLRPRRGSLLAISDLHITTPQNRTVVEGLSPESPADWLLFAGDMSEDWTDIEWALRLLTERFATVVLAPGNHDLWTPRHGPQPWLRGAYRYEQLVATCRALGVITPEDPYPIWHGTGGPVRIAPLFLLYDYSFAYNVAATKEAALERAWAAGVVCSDEVMLHPDPYPSRAAWCEARVTETERRLTESDLEYPDRPRQPLPVDRRADTVASPARVRTVVRHIAYRKVAHAIQRVRCCLRASPHAAHGLSRRSAIRGGVARLSPRVAAPRRLSPAVAAHPTARRAVIAAILPSTVVAVETRDFESDRLLFESERAVVVRAVEKRRRDFATGRACATPR